VVLTAYIGKQAGIQALSLFTGLLLVRALTPTEYAVFVLTNTMQAALSVLSESGVGSALSALGGKFWQDGYRLGQLVQTALSLRKRLAIVAGIVICPILWILLVRNGSGRAYALCLCLMVFAGTNFQLVSGVLSVVPKLHSRLDQLQKIDGFGAFLRLLLVVAVCHVAPNALLAILAGIVTFALQATLSRRYARLHANLEATNNNDDRLEILRVVKKVVPTTTFYTVQGVLSMFIIALLGNTRNLADIGALGRISMMLLILNSIVTNIILPRFSRCHDTFELSRMYLGVVGAFILVAVLITLVTTSFPDPFLWILGKNYLHLGSDLPYVTGLATINIVGGTIYGLNYSKAWMNYAWLSVPIIICSQIALLPFIDLSTIKGVIIFSAFPQILSWIPYLWEANNELRR
jgi:O-antigen/teichoic acid export membrane protein